MALNERIAPEFAAVASRFSVNLNGVTEALWQPIYDTLTYPAAGATNLVAFQNPVGVGGTTKALTNVQSAGMFPAGQNFIGVDISVELIPAALTTVAAYITDCLAFYNSGWLELNIGSKNYLTEAPMGAFPTKHRLDVFAVNDASAAPTVFRYAQNRGEIYQITPVLIPQNQNFNITLQWPALVPISAQSTIQVKMGGYLFRTAQ